MKKPLMVLLGSILFFCNVSTFGVAPELAEGLKKRPLPTPRAFINTLVDEMGEKSALAFQKMIDSNLSAQNSVEEFYPRELNEKDAAQLTEVITALRKHKAQITYKDNAFYLFVGRSKMKIKMVDFISKTFTVNGEAYRLTNKKSLEEHSRELIFLTRKKTVMDYIPFIESAHAILPLAFAIPAIIAAAGSGAVMDFTLGNAANDLENMSFNNRVENKEKVAELEDIYEKRADECEADLGGIATNTGGRSMTTYQSVRVVADLHNALDAELYEKWFNGKTRIDYEELGCEKVAEDEGFSIGSVTGFFRSEGGFLRKLCGLQDRLNNCLQEVEEKMREENIQVNDVPGADGYSPLGDIVDEYKNFGNGTFKH